MKLTLSVINADIGSIDAAMLPMGELVFTGIVENLAALDPRSRIRADKYGCMSIEIDSTGQEPVP